MHIWVEFPCVCRLPVPWLLYSFANGMAPVAVSSNGLFCAIVLLFLMLLFVIISIAVCKWRMNKMLGFTMFMLYFVFLVLSVMLEDRIIVCPVSIWVTPCLPVFTEMANTPALTSHLSWSISPLLTSRGDITNWIPSCAPVHVCQDLSTMSHDKWCMMQYLQ